MAKDTEHRIMEAALELFSASSYGSVSVESIARRAGMSKGGLFHHFPSKFDLAFRSLFWAMDRMMGQALSDRGTRVPTDRLKMFIDTSLEMMAGNSSLSRMAYELFTKSIGKKKELGMWTGILERYLDHVEGLYSSTGVPRPRARATLLLATLDGYGIYQPMLSPDPQALEDERTELYRMFVPGMEGYQGR